jgi:hypothetical protein
MITMKHNPKKVDNKSNLNTSDKQKSDLVQKGYPYEFKRQKKFWIGDKQPTMSAEDGKLLENQPTKHHRWLSRHGRNIPYNKPRVKDDIIKASQDKSQINQNFSPINRQNQNNIQVKPQNKPNSNKNNRWTKNKFVPIERPKKKDDRRQPLVKHNPELVRN